MHCKLIVLFSVYSVSVSVCKICTMTLDKFTRHLIYDHSALLVLRIKNDGTVFELDFYFMT